MTRSNPSGNRPTSVSAVLSDPSSSFGKLLRRAGLLMQIEHLLSRRLEPGLAAQFQAATLHDGTLLLIASSAAWATRLRMQEGRLLDALQHAGLAEIHGIEVRVAPLVQSKTRERIKTPLSPAASQALGQMTRLVDDGD